MPLCVSAANHLPPSHPASSQLTNFTSSFTPSINHLSGRPLGPLPGNPSVLLPVYSLSKPSQSRPLWLHLLNIYQALSLWCPCSRAHPSWSLPKSSSTFWSLPSVFSLLPLNTKIYVYYNYIKAQLLFIFYPHLTETVHLFLFYSMPIYSFKRPTQLIYKVPEPPPIFNSCTTIMRPKSAFLPIAPHQRHLRLMLHSRRSGYRAVSRGRFPWRIRCTARWVALAPVGASEPFPPRGVTSLLKMSDDWPAAGAH